MNIIRNDKVVLIQEFDKLNSVGMTYEVANITDNVVVLRDAKSKIAVCAIDIEDFDKYFKRFDEARTKMWTKWQGIADIDGNVIAFYKTNWKKIKVKTVDGFRAETTCCKDDEFNLAFGVNLAIIRCKVKRLKQTQKDFETSLECIRNDLIESENMIKQMLDSLNKESK